MNCSIAVDRAFGPNVPQCRRTFDFTLLFEETIFSIAPSTLFLLIVILRLSVLWKRPSRVQRGRLYKLKLVSLSCDIKTTKTNPCGGDLSSLRLTSILRSRGVLYRCPSQNQGFNTISYAHISCVNPALHDLSS